MSAYEASSKQKPTYIIGTGWWCTSEPITWKRVLGDDIIRSKYFHQLWYYAIDKYTDPEKICIVDSASPIQPDLVDDDRLEWISLTKNFHTFQSPYHWEFDQTGWVKSVLVSAYFALACEVDYFIYVEQDCLVRGYDWVDKAISKLEEHVAAGYPGWMFGDGRKGCPGNHLLQQSLFLVKQSSLWEFIQKLTLRPVDEHLTPEERFARKLEQVSFLPFGYGRSRQGFSIRNTPMYAQHWTKDEIKEWYHLETQDNIQMGFPERNSTLEVALQNMLTY